MAGLLLEKIMTSRGIFFLSFSLLLEKKAAYTQE